MPYSVPDWFLDEPSDIMRVLENVTITSEHSVIEIRGIAGHNDPAFSVGDVVFKRHVATDFVAVRKSLDRWICELGRRVTAVRVINI